MTKCYPSVVCSILRHFARGFLPMLCASWLDQALRRRLGSYGGRGGYFGRENLGHLKSWCLVDSQLRKIWADPNFGGRCM